MNNNAPPSAIGLSANPNTFNIPAINGLPNIRRLALLKLARIPLLKIFETTPKILFNPKISRRPKPSFDSTVTSGVTGVVGCTSDAPNAVLACLPAILSLSIASEIFSFSLSIVS